LKKDENVTQHELLKIIVENNNCFEQRTEFSKLKYMKRKKNKYLFYFTV